MTTTGATSQASTTRVTARAAWPALREALGVVWLPWLIARVLVGAALVLSRYLVSHVSITSAKAIATSHEGLESWDAGWYVQIARGGYHSVASSGLRFFPLYPDLITGLHDLTRAPVGALAVVVANGASFLAALALYLLARRELDATSANRSVWLLCLAPASFVLVMAYAEALFLLLAIAAFLCLRGGRWWTAAILGLALGATRPLGLALLLPALVEVSRSWRGAPLRTRVAQSLAVVAPLVGTIAYLSWVAAAFGDFFAPLRAQTRSSAHGGLSDPFSVLAHATTDLFHGHVGTALHVPWIVLSMGLLVVCARRLPASYTLFAGAIVLAALSGSNLDSFERYALSAFPLLVAGGTLVRAERVATPVLIGTSVAMFAYALLAFLGAYVP